MATPTIDQSNRSPRFSNCQLTKTTYHLTRTDNDFHTGCWNITHKKQSFSGLQSPRWSSSIKVCYSRVQTIFLWQSSLTITLSTITSQFNSNQGQNSTYFYEFLLFCTCVQDLSWETTLSLVQTQEFCVSLYHALQQELLSQWPWMQKISLFPRKHDQLLNIDYQQILYVPNMQVNHNENALIAPLPKTTSVHQSNHVQNVFAFHIN